MVKQKENTSTKIPLEEPPPYSHGTPSSSNNAKFSPPPNAQKALAPLAIKANHEDIKGDFIIINEPSDSPADVSIKTNHSKVSTTLWFQKAASQPYVIEANTAHAPLDLTLVSLKEQ